MTSNKKADKADKTKSSTPDALSDAAKQKKAREHELAAREAGGATAGGVIGAIFGLAGGPGGALVGAGIGAAVGAIAERSIEQAAEERYRHNAELDKEIGVTGGDLGAPNLKHPPARVGALSGASSGAAAPSPPIANGPMPPPEDD